MVFAYGAFNLRSWAWYLGDPATCSYDGDAETIRLTSNRTFEVEDGTARIGYPKVLYLRWLRQFPPLPLARLAAIDHDSPEYNEPGKQEQYYAQCWALVHYLLVGDDFRFGRNRGGDFALLARAGRLDEAAGRYAEYVSLYSDGTDGPLAGWWSAARRC